ncbi:hypothetical protein D3C85_1005200 [compost metagenome]
MGLQRNEFRYLARGKRPVKRPAKLARFDNSVRPVSRQDTASAFAVPLRVSLKNAEERPAALGVLRHVRQVLVPVRAGTRETAGGLADPREVEGYLHPLFLWRRSVAYAVKWGSMSLGSIMPWLIL